jgi:ornithine cyclodeaminase/alanine dehydrogenase-like protein (mu-crystallin family)
MNQSTPRILSSEDIKQALPMQDAVGCMRDAFVQLSSKLVVVPPRTHIHASVHDGDILVMPSYSPHEERLGIKTITLYAGNPSKGLPRIQALMTLFDGTDGRPLAIMDGSTLTAIRTGAGSGVATDLMARTDASTAAIFGAGLQAETQLEAVCTVRDIKNATLFDLDADRAAKAAGMLSDRLGISVRAAASPAEALADADIVCTATTAHRPVFKHAELKRGAHINAIGSYQPNVQELPAETVLKSRVVVDHKESALAETGDLLIPMDLGMFTEKHITAEIGQIVSGDRIGRASADEITLYKSVGVAIQDLVAANRAYLNAIELGLGINVQL